MEHLSNIDSKKRESEAIFQFFCCLSLPPQIEDFFKIFRGEYIVGMNIPFQSIMKGKLLKSHFTFEDGDIDVCLLPIKETVAHGVINNVTPNFDNIIAIEVKSMGFSNYSDIVSPKNKQEIYREQVNKLCQLGFNEVTLLYIIATEPPEVAFGDFNDWKYAMARVSAAAEKLDNIVIESFDNFSTLGLFIGAIKNETEVYSNASGCNVYNKNHNNGYFNRDNPFRKAFEAKVNALFPYEVHSHRLPIQIRGCNTCKELFLFPQAEKPVCPKCNALFR